MNVLTELKRRKVYQVAAVYAAAAWGLLQVADVIFPRLGLPDWSVTFLFALEVVGFPLALILSWIFDFTPGGVVRTGAESSHRRMAGNRESLAVLPFSNMSDDKTLDHLADGLVEDLITHLQGNLGIPVNSRNSTFIYKGTAVDIVKAADELGAAFVVEGSVRVQGDTARITAQLINASNDHHIWAEKFDRPLGNIFALQDELVESIAAAIMKHIPSGEVEEASEAVAEDKPVGLRKGWVAFTVALLLGLSGVLTWSLEQRGDERWAREVAIPEIEKLIEADDHINAYARIAAIAAILPSDPLLLKYRDAVSSQATIRTDPGGVSVSYKPFGVPDVEWTLLGLTPLEKIRLPLGHLHLKFEDDQVVTTERLVINPSFMLDNSTFLPTAKDILPDPMFFLAKTTEGRDNMVYVEPWQGPVPTPGVNAGVPIPGFFIDTYEVTNAQFQEFVDAGGYSDGRFWSGLDFGAVEWPEAVLAFTDQTGQPGPAGWELGRYVHGTGDHPVTGVSWFEASAYARFRGKELPTLFHWYRTTLSYAEQVDPLGPAIIKQSNYTGEGPAPVGQYQGLSFYGAYDMGGNAREWLENADQDLRWIVGGGWNQVPYMLPQGDYASPFDRGPTNGFRCMINADGSPTPKALTVSTNQRAWMQSAQEEPVSDEVYAIYRDQFGYPEQALNPQLVTSREWPHWREELVHINSPYSEEGMDVLLLLPGENDTALQAMILMPGSDAFFPGASMKGYNWEDYEASVAAVLHSGRAIVIPVWEGSFSRGRRLSRAGVTSADEWQERTRRHVMHWRQDLGTALDYLQTRDDIDSDRVGYLGISYGASNPLTILAVEPRLKTAVLVAGGLALQDGHPSVKPIHHISRITMPVLMMSGRYDHTFPLLSEQIPMFELIGSDADQKKHVVYEAGHVGFPANQQRREIRAWLDTYLGKDR